MSRFTKQALRDSFLNLAAKKPVEKITVRDIVEDCGVNRNTFYYYFSDIYALLEDLLVTETEKAIAVSRECKTLSDGFVAIFEWIEAHYDAFRSIYSAIGRDSVEYAISRAFDREIVAYVRKCAENITVSETDIYLVSGVIRSIYFGALSDWARRNVRVDPKVYAKRIEAMFSKSVTEALQIAATLPIVGEEAEDVRR